MKRTENYSVTELLDKAVKILNSETEKSPDEVYKAMIEIISAIRILDEKIKDHDQEFLRFKQDLSLKDNW